MGRLAHVALGRGDRGAVALMTRDWLINVACACVLCVLVYVALSS